MTDFIGGSGDDRLIGRGKPDSFDISQGGADIVKGAGGDDVVMAGGAFGADDRVNGGDGNDTLVLDGDYSAGLVFGDRTLVKVERIELAPGHSYDLTLSAAAAAGNVDSTLTVNTDGLAADRIVRIDASAFQAGSQLQFTSTSDAASTVTGGAGDDLVVLAGTGRFDVAGGDGSDTVALYRAMTVGDHFDGGAGANDTLVMLAGQSTTLTGAMVEGLETLWVFGGDFDVSMRDNALAGGAVMHIYGGDLEAGQHLAFDGSRERAGDYTITGGADSDILAGGRGDDSIAAGAGDDRITGGQGADLISGEAGADSFVYDALNQSGHHGLYDLITDLEADDAIDLSAIDARADKAGDQAFHLVAAFTGHAGELALSYDADADVTTLRVDVDGDARADMAVHITGDRQGFDNFVL